MKYCKDCKYFEEGRRVDLCAHPNLGRELVYGGINKGIPNSVRLAKSKCG